MAVMRACLQPVIQCVYHLITLIHERGAGRERGNVQWTLFLVAEYREERAQYTDICKGSFTSCTLQLFQGN